MKNCQSKLKILLRTREILNFFHKDILFAKMERYFTKYGHAAFMCSIIFIYFLAALNRL